MTYAKELLRRRNIQQKDLARVLRINRARVSLVLSGKGDKPSVSETEKLQRFFGLPLSILLTPYDEESQDVSTNGG